MSEFRGAISTALQFMASFRSVRVLACGSSGGLCWISIYADEDGTEEQHFFVMERRHPEFRNVELKILMNLSSTEINQATLNPQGFWNHPRAHTPQH